MLQEKIEETKQSYQQVDKQIKVCVDIMNKAGIRPIEESRVSFEQAASQNKSPKEMRMMVAHLEAKLEALINEREKLDAMTRSNEAAAQNKMMDLQAQINKNVDLEQKYIAIRSRDPFEIKREIQEIKNREVDLTNRINTLKNLPMYKNDGGADALIRLKESENILIDLKGQDQIETKKVDGLQKETDMLKKEIDGIHYEKQNIRKEMSKVKAMYEASVSRQNRGLNKVALMKEHQEMGRDEDRVEDMDEFNEKLVRTLGLVRWKGEEPAWYKIQNLERNNTIDPQDSETIRNELYRLKNQKRSLATKLDVVEGLLKATVEEERRQEDEHLIMKKKKENDLLRLEEKRKELQSTLDIMGTTAGRTYAGKNQRTGEEVFYNDGVSVFSMDKSDLFKISHEENLLDLYLDRLDMNPAHVKVALEHIRVVEVNPAGLVTAVAVNFFNHPTLTSQKCFGLAAEIKMQCTFAFRCDGFFIEYCKSNSLDVDVFYTTDNGFQQKFATASIEMKDLLDASLKEKRDDYIGVVNKVARVHSIKGDHIGILSFRMKPRLPIYRDIISYNSTHISEEKDSPVASFDSKHIGKERTLFIKVCNGYGFSSQSETFITYRFMQNEQVTTPKKTGVNPKFDHLRDFRLVYSKGIREFLKNNKIEVMAFDDSVPYNQQGPLVDNNGLKLRDFLGSGL